MESELAKILALALAYHPLVDLTPFSVATAGGAVRKLERGGRGQESARKNIQSCLKLLKSWLYFRNKRFGFCLWT